MFLKGLAMANDSAPDAKQKSAAATPATTAAVQKASTPAAKAVAAKPAAKPAVKTAVKTAAKQAPKAAVVVSPKASAVVAEKAAGKPVAKVDKNAKPKKAKLVRDSFTMPELEYGLIAAVKKRCIAKGVAVKKSEVLRAAIISFAAQSDAAVSAALEALEIIKTGRPPKGQK